MQFVVSKTQLADNIYLYNGFLMISAVIFEKLFIYLNTHYVKTVALHAMSNNYKGKLLQLQLWIKFNSKKNSNDIHVYPIYNFFNRFIEYYEVYKNVQLFVLLHARLIFMIERRNHCCKCKF